jgi:hypothetical protein
LGGGRKNSATKLLEQHDGFGTTGILLFCGERRVHGRIVVVEKSTMLPQSFTSFRSSIIIYRFFRRFFFKEWQMHASFESHNFLFLTTKELWY